MTFLETLLFHLKAKFNEWKEEVNIKEAKIDIYTDPHGDKRANLELTFGQAPKRGVRSRRKQRVITINPESKDDSKRR